MIRRIGFEEAKALLDSEPEAVLLDVREEAEYITGHAADAVLLPVDELTDETALDAIPSLETPVLVYCRSGYRSNVAAHRLEEYGYERIYDLGSLIGWPYGLE
ncbi:MAG: rhodanese-like domain-containing protein [Oscillospiraceae bacterium]|jgi:rhodanese-related sulfurtransferase|nr:rhodanese-like domain-containing protein [Oscillospiraceae bacterium]